MGGFSNNDYKSNEKVTIKSRDYSNSIKISNVSEFPWN